MRITFAILLLTSVSFGCSRERSQTVSQQNPRGENAPNTPSADGASPGRHVLLSASDLARELSEHCGKANDALTRAVVASSARVLDTKQLSAELEEARKSMSTCMAMVHGVEEAALGTGPEQRRQAK